MYNREKNTSSKRSRLSISKTSVISIISLMLSSCSHLIIRLALLLFQPIAFENFPTVLNLDKTIPRKVIPFILPLSRVRFMDMHVMARYFVSANHFVDIFWKNQKKC